MAILSAGHPPGGFLPAHGAKPGKSLKWFYRLTKDKPMPKILLIDDDERLAELLDCYFVRFELELTSATHPSEGLTLLADNSFDLVILDIMLPEMDGFEVCKAIRKTSEIPIIMLTARGEVMDRVVGLELGADDYLPKPFEPRELVARIRSILKRKRSAHVSEQGAVIAIDALELDTDRRNVRLEGDDVELSSSEYQLLELFARNPGKTFNRDEILTQLKGIEADIYSRSVDILVSRLRQKLKPHTLIHTIRGQGYRFIGKTK
jgi:OmpR family response regulator RpaB